MTLLEGIQRKLSPLSFVCSSHAASARSFGRPAAFLFFRSISRPITKNVIPSTVVCFRSCHASANSTPSIDVRMSIRCGSTPIEQRYSVCRDCLEPNCGLARRSFRLLAKRDQHFSSSAAPRCRYRRSHVEDRGQPTHERRQRENQRRPRITRTTCRGSLGSIFSPFIAHALSANCHIIFSRSSAVVPRRSSSLP
jgi:hypothetical protein